MSDKRMTSSWLSRKFSLRERSRRAQATFLVLSLVVCLMLVTFACKVRMLPYHEDDQLHRWLLKVALVGSLKFRLATVAGCVALGAGLACTRSSTWWRLWRCCTPLVFALLGMLFVANEWILAQRHAATLVDALSVSLWRDDLSRYLGRSRGQEWLAITAGAFILALAMPRLLRRVTPVRFVSRRLGAGVLLGLILLALVSSWGAHLVRNKYSHLRRWYASAEFAPRDLA